MVIQQLRIRARGLGCRERRRPIMVQACRTRAASLPAIQVIEADDARQAHVFDGVHNQCRPWVPMGGLRMLLDRKRFWIIANLFGYRRYPPPVLAVVAITITSTLRSRG